MPAMSSRQLGRGLGQAGLEALEPALLLGRLGAAAAAAAAGIGCGAAAAARQPHRRLGAVPARARRRRAAEQRRTGRALLPACRSRRTLGRERLALQPPAVGPVTRARSSCPGGAGSASSISAKPGVRPSRSRSTSSSTSLPDLAPQMARRALPRPCCPQPRRPLLDAARGDLRHARRRRARARREREDVQEGQAAVVDEPQRVGEHRLGLGREAGDQVGAEDDVRPQPPRLLAEADGVGAQSAGASCASGSCRRRTAARGADAASAAAPRRWPRMRCASASTWSIEERRRRCSSGTWRRMWRTSLPERHLARQVGAVARDVDAGEHDLGVAGLDQPAHLRHHLAGRHRARRPAAVGDDAEGAAVVAAVLHLHVGARAASRSRRSVACAVSRTDMMSLTCDARAVGEAQAAEGLGVASSRRCR